MWMGICRSGCFGCIVMVVWGETRSTLAHVQHTPRMLLSPAKCSVHQFVLALIFHAPPRPIAVHNSYVE